MVENGIKINALTCHLREGADGDGDIETDHSTDGSWSGSPVSS